VGFDLLLVSDTYCKEVHIAWRVVSPATTRLSVSWSQLRSRKCR